MSSNERSPTDFCKKNILREKKKADTTGSTMPRHHHVGREQRLAFIQRELRQDWVGGLPYHYLHNRLQLELGTRVCRRSFIADLGVLGWRRRTPIVRSRGSLKRIVRLVRKISDRNINMGIRTIKFVLMFEFNLHVPRDLVEEILLRLNPQAVRYRRYRRLVRRRYTSRGVLYALHCDGWDKLRPWGICFHGAGID